MLDHHHLFLAETLLHQELLIRTTQSHLPDDILPALFHSLPLLSGEHTTVDHHASIDNAISCHIAHAIHHLLELKFPRLFFQTAELMLLHLTHKANSFSYVEDVLLIFLIPFTAKLLEEFKAFQKLSL